MIITILELALKYGVPEVMAAVQNWKDSHGGNEPTVEQAVAIMEGVVPPEEKP